MVFETFVPFVSGMTNQITTNLSQTFTNMTLEKWIRVVIIVGAYCLLRPYIIQLGAKSQMKSHEKEAAESEAAYQAKISANELRGIKLPGVDSDDEDEDESAATGADWGKKARRRQRTMIKKLLEAEEARLQETKEEEEDKDIEEFLVKT
ncbi:protein trafficking Pga2 [Bombardia bombarda]|uniref:Protein trafficking Pga2 n=1 Tax=Bombardia bombarda TaxID=252184 RepID=A0AA39XK20_9PEZI|nr:protein trafficking Pga2 [Bombardia bombarda]